MGALSTFGSERFSKQRLIDEVRRQERALTGRFHLDSEPLSNGKYVFETNTLWLSSDVIAHACQLHRAERVYWQGSDVPVGGMMDPLAVNEFNQRSNEQRPSDSQRGCQPLGGGRGGERRAQG